MNREYLIRNKYYSGSVMPKMVPLYINDRIENYNESLVFDLLKNTPEAVRRTTNACMYSSRQ